MIEIKQAQEKKSKLMYESHQKDYILHLKSLLPSEFLEEENKNSVSIFMPTQNINTLQFFNTKAMKNIKFNLSLSKSRVTLAENKKVNSTLGEFLLRLVKNIAQQKYVDEYGPLENITKELGIDIKQLNKIDDSEAKIQFMLNSIDKQIEDQKKKVFYSKNSMGSSMTAQSQKPCSSNLSMSNLATKQNNFMHQNQPIQKVPSKYESFIREQNKKEVDNFAWLQIKTKYPTLQKKLKSKLIQSINEEKNQKRIRQLIQKKQKSKKLITNTSAFSNNNFVRNSSLRLNSSTIVQSSSRDNQFVDIQDEKIELINESLFMEEFEKAKIQYTWTENDEKMFLKNIKELRKKCSNNSEFLKNCGRFKFISQKEFQTLASEEISRMLNTNNKIYLSREFLLDKYFSTTQILTEQEMRFILKTSPMLSKCVDRNFIRTAIKNIKYENISDLELKIAEDIIGRFQKLRNSVRVSRKAYKQQINQATKERIAFFEYNKELQIAQEIAREELKHHKVHLMRAINFNKKHPLQGDNKSRIGLKKKSTKNVWTPLNKFHPSTGLFVKDCNEQCTDDIFNPYEIQYLKQMNETKETPKKNSASKVEMIKFYTGGPDENITTTFNVAQTDIQNLCSIVKAHFFQKKILSALQSIQIVSHECFSTKREDTKSYPNDMRTKKTLGPNADEEFEMMAKKKLLENRQKAKDAVYITKLLNLAAQNSYAGLRALNPQFTAEQVNTKDKKGNTALFYATKFGNQEFVQFLVKFGANPNIKCQKDFTPLHYGFKSNNVNLILRLLTTSSYSANLNSLNNQFKTPLAYASREVLKKLNLEQGVVSMDPNASSMMFDNNALLQKGDFDRIKEQSLEVEGEFAKRANELKVPKKKNSTLTSLQNMSID